MFALPGIAALMIFILARPQEFIPLLQRVPFLYLFAAFAVIGYVIDLRLRRLQPIAANTLPWVIAFLVWAVVCTAVVAPAQVGSEIAETSILLVLYGTIAHGVQRFRTFQLIAGVLAATCMFIAVVCLHQGFSPKQCVGGEEQDGAILGKPDGRLCETDLQCRGPGAEPGLEYRCEHIGLFGTYSVGGRVRYRGELHDPNEVALTICAGALAMLIAFSLRKPGPVMKGTYWLAAGAVLLTVLLTESRGGLLSALLVPGVYVIRRYGWKAIIPAVLIAVPVILLASRGGADAEESTLMRYDAWSTGLDMFHHSPIFGVGPRNFDHHFFITAHNSFVLTLSEMGFPGLFLFSAIIYLVFKTLLVGMRELRDVPGTAAPQIWGMALFAAMAGVVFQINTLSFAYHSVLWLMLGMCGAWYSAVRYHRPELKIELTLVDVVVIAGADLAYAFVVLPIFLKIKGFR